MYSPRSYGIKFSILALILVVNGALVQAVAEVPTSSPQRWFDAFRPTDTYFSLDGQWRVSTVVGDRGDLWRRPSEFSSAVSVPELEPTWPNARQVPHSQDLTLNWYQKEFQLPAHIMAALDRGERAFLHLGGVAWRWSAWVNGQPIVEACYDVLNSREIDVTALLKRTGNNTLVIAATDAHGLARDLKYARLFNPKVRADRDGDFQAPAPETTGEPMIWGEVELWMRPAKRIDDVFVRPDFRHGRLDLDLELTDAKGAEVIVNVMDSTGLVKEVVFTNRKVVGSVDGATDRLTLSAPWASPRLWQPDDPYLYFAEVELRESGSGALLDRRKVRFGFREIWIEGGNIMMNGRRLFLARHFISPKRENSTEGGPGNAGQQLAVASGQWRAAGGINSVRLHRPGFCLSLIHI